MQNLTGLSFTTPSGITIDLFTLLCGTARGPYTVLSNNPAVGAGNYGITIPQRTPVSVGDYVLNQLGQIVGIVQDYVSDMGVILLQLTNEFNIKKNDSVYFITP